MDRNEIKNFALKLMHEVWEPFDDKKVRDFYHSDLVGHHRDQIIGIEDVENRLRFDQENFTNPVYKIINLTAGYDEFSIHFNYKAQLPDDDLFQVEVMYFYRLKKDLISEFWTLASVDFDYLEKF